MQRLINRRQQGDLGEASAIEWLTRQGATVSVPLGHSPDYDLIAEVEGQILRVQVKTSVRGEMTPNRHSRWAVAIRTNGGNQSWTGVTKRFDATKVDALFALVGDGRRWFIPAEIVEGSTAITVGGVKYSEFEIESTRPIEDLVYGRGPKINGTRGSAGVGEPGWSVKSVPFGLSEFDSHLPHVASQGSEQQPPTKRPPRAPGASSRTRISRSHQVTIPIRPFNAAGFRVGDAVRVHAIGEGEALLSVIERSPDGCDGHHGESRDVDSTPQLVKPRPAVK